VERHPDFRHAMAIAIAAVTSSAKKARAGLRVD
jgi:hypothetical protein